MKYFEEQSIFESTSGNDIQAMTILANKYVADNPVELPIYRTSNTEGFLRDGNYRYQLYFNQKFSNLKNGQVLYAWSKISGSKNKTTEKFYINVKGPTKVYCNGKMVFKSSLVDENIAGHFSNFSVLLEEAWNSIVVESVVTATGCGCLIGTSSIKGNPFYVFTPGKGDVEEGWFYSLAQDEKWSTLPTLETVELDRWLPQSEWSSKERLKTPFERLFDQKKGETMIARCQVSVKCDGKYFIKTNALDSTQIWIDDKKVISKEKMSLAAGEHEVIAFVKAMEQVELTIALGNQDENRMLKVKSVFNDSFLSKWSYLGPFANEMRPTISDLRKKHVVYSGHYWCVDEPNKTIRPFLDASLFGRWNYPLGVTLRGLIQFAKDFQREDILDYIQQHIELCTKFYDYARWDRKTFGAQGIDYCLAAIDSLDDCGSFAATMLELMKYRTVEYGEQVADVVAHYIENAQSRQADGVLYREKGHALLMNETLWADDVYMSVPFLIRYSDLKKDTYYFEEAIKQILLYKKYLYLPQRRLFSHVYNFNFGKATEVTWGRGNGWILFSLADLIKHLDKKHEKYQALLNFFNDICHGFVDVQKENGMWNQVLGDFESYEETSCTAMVICAFSQWQKDLSPFEGRIIQNRMVKAWQAILDKMIDKKGNLYGVCRGSGYSFDPNYYKYDLLPRLNDTHGIGIVLLAGCYLSEMRLGNHA